MRLSEVLRKGAGALKGCWKGPADTGGIVWKTHARAKLSQGQKANIRKEKKLIRTVRDTLREAAALQAAPEALPTHRNLAAQSFAASGIKQ
jgi:hypothetical protein